MSRRRIPPLKRFEWSLDRVTAVLLSGFIVLSGVVISTPVYGQDDGGSSAVQLDPGHSFNYTLNATYGGLFNESYDNRAEDNPESNSTIVTASTDTGTGFSGTGLSAVGVVGSYGNASLDDTWEAPAEGTYTVTSEYTLQGQYSQHRDFSRVGRALNWIQVISKVQVVDITPGDDPEVVKTMNATELNAVSPSFDTIGINLLVVGFQRVISDLFDLPVGSSATKVLNVADVLGINTEDRSFGTDNGSLSVEFEAEEGHVYLIRHYTDAGTVSGAYLTGQATAEVSVQSTVEELSVRKTADTTSDQTTTVAIESTGDDRAFYEFTTDGNVEPGEQVNLDEAEYPDRVTDRGAGGSVLGGTDTYQVSGEITHMDVDGPVNVYVDGEQVDPEDEWGSSLSNTLTVRSTGDQSATYEFSVSDTVEPGDEADMVPPDHPDTISDQSASGSVLGGADSYHFSGEITDLQVDGPAEVYVNGEEVDPAEIGTGAEETNIDAEIVDFAPEAGTFTPGETHTAEVTVENTGNTRHTFFVGYSVRSPDGEGLHNGGAPPHITLAPGERETITVEWTVEGDAPTGTYGAFTAVWEDREGGDLQTQLDLAEQTDVFTVDDTDIEATATDTEDETQDETTTGFQAGYGGASNETTTTAEPATTVTESEPTTASNTQTTTATTSTPDDGAGTADTEQGTAQQTTGTTGPGFGTLAALLAIIVLALFAARRT